MRLTDSAGWQSTLDANPIPAGFSPEPEDWPEHLTNDQRGDCYGAICLIAAQRWAEAMEERIDAGATVADCAHESFTVVDHHLGRWGVTGFQYGVIVSLLAQVWEHGEDLRRWHNLDTQIGNEGERANETGGTLNPALLSVSEG